MPETSSYPYETRLNILYPPLELIDEKSASTRATTSVTTRHYAKSTTLWSGWA